MFVRYSVKALIIQNNHLLVVEKLNNKGRYFVLPGGGQEFGETFCQTLKRECVEELGFSIKVINLIFVREYIGKNHDFSDMDEDVHQVEFIFSCSIKEKRINYQTERDEGQIGISWLHTESLNQHRIFPSVLKEVIRLMNDDDRPIYLGDIN